jgi:hypothetical protein
MADPKAQAARQLQNILTQTGKTIEDFAAAVRAAGLTKHGQMVAHFKSTAGLGHGNANLLAHTVRTHLAGGAPDPAALLAAQYAGRKAPLRPIYDRLAAIAESLEGVTKVVQKTGVSFRASKQFLLVQAPSSKRVRIGLNLDETPADARVVPATGMCNHTANITSLDAIDDALIAVIHAAWRRARG